MAFQRPLQFGAHGLYVGHIDRDAGRAAGNPDVDDVEECAVAAHDRRDRVVEGRFRRRRRANAFARHGRQHLAAFIDRLLRRARFDRLAISLVDPGEAAHGVTLPGRHGRPGNMLLMNDTGATKLHQPGDRRRARGNHRAGLS